MTTPRLAQRSQLTRASAGLLAMMMLWLLVGCSGGSTDEAASDAGADDAPQSSAELSEDFAEAEALTSEDESAAGDSGETITSAALPAAQDRTQISTGTMTLRAEDLAATRIEVRKVLDTYRGLIGEEETESNGKGELTFARLVLRLPSDRFAEAMDDLEKISKFNTRAAGTVDVTTQVIDVEARVRAQTKSLARIEALLAEASTFKDVVAIESQLTSRQAELESLKAQQAYLADQTSLSTITVYLEQLNGDDPEPVDDSGFLAGLRGGWHALTTMSVGLVTALGAVLPFAVALAVVGYPLWLLGRRFGKTLTVRPRAVNAQEVVE